MKKLVFMVSNGSGDRLDRWLSEQEGIETRSRAAKLIGDGQVFVNQSNIKKASYRVDSGDEVTVNIPIQSSSTLEPYEFSLDILFEDEHIIVINKPSGIVVHPSAGHEKETLVNALVHHTDDLSMGFSEQRPGVVHRLDKDTSGVLVFAKNNQVHENLAQQFKEKTVNRIYWAIVYGELKYKETKIESSHIRHPQNRKKFASEKIRMGQKPKGKIAITHVTQLQNSRSGLSWVQCQLETGRTHQIRVHLSEQNHPIVGDPIYGGLQRSKNLKSVKVRQIIQGLNRVALHAYKLGFLHPKTNKELEFTTPWPQNLSELLSECDLGASK